MPFTLAQALGDDNIFERTNR